MASEIEMKAENPASKEVTTVGAQERTSLEDGEVKETVKYSKLSVLLMIIFSGLAIGSDGFNASIIGTLSLVLGVLYPDALTTGMYSRLSNAFIIGMILGMLGFGYISDKLGRKSGAVLTTIILVLGIILSAAASGTTQTGMLWMLVVARGVAGVGAGGEYPVAGAGAAEATDENAGVRGRRGFIFAMIADLSATLGFVFGGLVPLLLILCVNQDESRYEIVWRTSLALGAVPPLAIFWFRYRMAVSTAYRKSSMKKQNPPYLLIIKRYWRPLLGTSCTWFVYNFVAYPFGLFSSTMLTRVNAGSSLTKNIGWGVLVNCFYIPGAFIGGYLSDKIGRRQTMALGFLLQGLFGIILGGALGSIEKILPLFIVMYGVFLTLGEVGPGSTVVIASSESFPTSIRGQCMGYAAAFSKAGAAIGTAVFKPILASYSNELKGNQAVFLIGAGFALLGAIIAWFVLPDPDKRLDNEDERWKEYLKAHGYEVQWGDESTKDPNGLMKDAVASGPEGTTPAGLPTEVPVGIDRDVRANQANSTVVDEIPQGIAMILQCHVSLITRLVSIVVMAANAPQDCLSVLSTSLALIDQFQQSLATTNVSNVAAGATVDQPSPLLLFKAASESLKGSTTRLSLLSITPPFTSTAISSLLKPLNESALPSLVTAALLVTPAHFPDSFASEATRLCKVTLLELRSLLELVEKRAKDGKPKSELRKEEKQNVTEATGRVWKSCDAVIKFSSDGIPGYMTKKAEQWLALMKDAVQELQEWDPEEDVDEDIFGDAGSDDEEDSGTKFTDKENDQDQATIAAGVKEQALKVLSRIPQSIHVVVKQRLAKMPAALKTGEQPLSSEQKRVLNDVLRDARLISECIDESAEAMYMGDPELCLKKAGEARALTIRVVEMVVPPWQVRNDGQDETKEDGFIKKALLWIQQVDLSTPSASNNSGKG
ncbi:hypothetical protein PMZ80_007839 [Knufia obscura]|uniref:Major facilitator superfamily (MFS) profile domain-containing protein n=1 Tax=Knufia obscura TaxID=1635080 RepID=A0ABR0RFS2_9EURO|nr:hypothetical protein PMZ80_007839 [Knufia obscura]